MNATQIREIANSAQALAHTRTEVRSFIQAAANVLQQNRGSDLMHETIELAIKAWDQVAHVALIRANNHQGLEITRYVKDACNDIEDALHAAKGNFVTFFQLGDQGSEEAFLVHHEIRQAIKRALSVIEAWAKYTFDTDLLQYLPS